MMFEVESVEVAKADRVAVPSSYRFGSWPSVVERGGHFFDRAAMRFFSSRICWGTLTAHQGTNGGFLFVTSEESPYGPRSYSLRVVRESGDVDTLGDFGGYADRAAAVRALHRVNAASVVIA